MARQKNNKKKIKKGPRNPLEVNVWNQLVKKHGRLARFEYETKRLPYTLSKYYVPDFICVFPDGRTIYIEAKGWLRPSDRMKMLAVKRHNPDLDIRFLFAKDNKLNKDSKTTYTKWAELNGFPCAVGTIPKEWFR